MLPILSFDWRVVLLIGLLVPVIILSFFPENREKCYRHPVNCVVMSELEAGTREKVKELLEVAMGTVPVECG